MDVVDDQDVRGPEVMTKILHSSCLDAFMEEIHEGGAGDEADRCFGSVAEDSLADRLEEVCLSQTHTTMDEVIAWETSPHSGKAGNAGSYCLDPSCQRDASYDPDLSTCCEVPAVRLC